MEGFFSEFATKASRWCGKAPAFFIALLAVAAWAPLGPLFHYSDTWQLVINTGTSVVTFLMVFLLQHTQNRDTVAIQAKLDEIIRTSKAQNRYIGIEELADDRLEELHARSRAKAIQADSGP